MAYVQNVADLKRKMEDLGQKIEEITEICDDEEVMKAIQELVNDANTSIDEAMKRVDDYGRDFQKNMQEASETKLEG